jgi:transposase
LIVDAQSVKNTDTAGYKGYDADRKGALQAMRRCKASLGKVQRVLADAGYVGEPFALGVREVLGEADTVQIAKRSELHKFAVIPKRWVVEMVCTQMTKTNVLAAGAGGNDITNLDLGVFHDDPVNQKFDQLALLRKVCVRQSSLDTRAEILNADGKAGNSVHDAQLGHRAGLLAPPVHGRAVPVPGAAARTRQAG